VPYVGSMSNSNDGVQAVRESGLATCATRRVCKILRIHRNINHANIVYKGFASHGCYTAIVGISWRGRKPTLFFCSTELRQILDLNLSFAGHVRDHQTTFMTLQSIGTGRLRSNNRLHHKWMCTGSKLVTALYNTSIQLDSS
jgi:hypothetical protein